MELREFAELLGNFGEFFGAIAVVATLGYLVIQIKQNTSALRASSRQEIATSYRENNKLLADEKVARAYSIGMSQYPDLCFEDRSLFSMYMNDFGVFIQGAIALHESDQLEDETYYPYLSSFCSTLSTPGGSAWWSEVRPFYLKRMVERVDHRLAQGTLPEVLELLTVKLDD